MRHAEKLNIERLLYLLTYVQGYLFYCKASLVYDLLSYAFIFVALGLNATVRYQRWTNLRAFTIV